MEPTINQQDFKLFLEFCAERLEAGESVEQIWREWNKQREG